MEANTRKQHCAKKKLNAALDIAATELQLQTNGQKERSAYHCNDCPKHPGLDT